MTRKWIYVVMAGAITLGVHTAGSQEPPPPPPGAEMGPGGPIGPRMELLGFGEMHPGKVVTNAPYSATATIETMQKLNDGNTIDRMTQSSVYRDSQGRTRRDTTFTGAGPLAASGQPRSISMIHDPVAGTSYILHTDKKTAEQLPERHRGPKNGANLQNRFQDHIQEEIANGTLKKEDLGTQSINGISAQGTRYTKTIPAGQIGNASAITIVNEQWYSPDLQVIIKSTRTDPRMGTTTYNLTNIQRTEPAGSLFTVPSDYTVTQAKAHVRGKHAPSGPPPAPSDAPPVAPGE